MCLTAFYRILGVQLDKKFRHLKQIYGQKESFLQKKIGLKKVIYSEMPLHGI